MHKCNCDTPTFKNNYRVKDFTHYKCEVCGLGYWEFNKKQRANEMYKCLCGQNYELPQIVDDIIGLVSEENPVIETVIICPGCKKRGIKGGEYMWDIYDNNGKNDIRDAIMLFGADFIFDKHKEKVEINEDGTISVQYPVFMGIPKEEPVYTSSTPL